MAAAVRIWFVRTGVTRNARVRPLDVISDFVVDELPQLLAGQSQELLQASLSEMDRALTTIIYDHARTLERPHMSIACLDLAMLLHACEHRFQVRAPRLRSLLVELSQRLKRTPALSYEDVVLSNPLMDDPRLFSTGSIAAAEHDFLRIHAAIEFQHRVVLARLKVAMDAHASVTQCAEERDSLYQDIDAALSRAMGHWVELRHMPPESFAYFRDLYAAPPRSGHAGVSGRFSETMNSLRILVEGRHLLEVIPNYFDELLLNIQYYPSEGRTRLTNLIRAACMPEPGPAGCLEDLRRTHPLRFTGDLIARLRHYLDTAVNVHGRLVKRYLPHEAEAASGV